MYVWELGVIGVGFWDLLGGDACSVCNEGKYLYVYMGGCVCVCVCVCVYVCVFKSEGVKCREGLSITLSNVG